MVHWGFHKHHQSQILAGQEGPVENGVYGLVKRLTNNEGASLDYGDVVKIDISGNELIEKTEDLGDLLVAGVVAAAGPFANGALVPVLIYGYHPAVKVTGAVAAGDVLAASATDGTAETQSPPDEGAFARALTASAGGVVAALVNEPALGAGGAAAFTDLTDAPSSYAGEAGKLVAVKSTEDGVEFINPLTGIIYDATGATNGVTTSFATPSNFVAGSVVVHLNGLRQRAGTDYNESGLDHVNMVSAPAAGDELIIEYGNSSALTTGIGAVDYDPDLPPNSAGAGDDEFSDTALTGWTQTGSPDTFNATDLPGYLHVADNDGAEPCGGYKAFVPGAAAFTLAFKVYGDVSGAASNQVYAGVYDSSGTPIVVAGMLNGSAYIVKAAALGGGFTSGTYTYATGNLGVLYVVIQRDASTNYVVQISGDGRVWKAVASFSQAGTVGRIYVTAAGFSSSVAAAYFQYVRTLSTQSLLFGNTPSGLVSLATYQLGDPNKPPTIRNAMDDEFNDLAGNSGATLGLNAKWAWRNQGAASVSFTPGRMRLNMPAAASSQTRILEQAIAAGDFEVVLNCGMFAIQGNFVSVGLVLIDRTNGDFVKLALETGAIGTFNPPTRIIVQTWTNPTTFATGHVSVEYGPTHAYLRARRIGGNLYFDYSSDGESWEVAYNGLADPVGVNGVGIYANNENNTANQYGLFKWFRRTA